MTVKSKSGRVNGKHHKNLESFFKQYRLKIKVESNLIAIDYLDMNLNRLEGKYKPYRKTWKHATVYKYQF